MSQSQIEKASVSAERIMFEQILNTDDAIDVAEVFMSPRTVNSGGVGIDSEGVVWLTLDGWRVPIAKDVAQAILRGLLKHATVTL